MLQHVKMTSSWYREDLQSQIEQTESKSKKMKQKIVDDEIKAVSAKCWILQSKVKSITEESSMPSKQKSTVILIFWKSQIKTSKAKQKEIEELDAVEENLYQNNFWVIFERYFFL